MEKKPYEKPKVTTYSEAEILDIIGPAQTSTSGAVEQMG
jgi:hypothetical protein